MRRLAACREHVRLDDEFIIKLLEREVARHDPEVRISLGTPAQFRACHDMLVSFFQIGCAEGCGITPASHRGGGATHFFQITQNVDWAFWRGRWA
eukprot:13384862-Alexandrium_andersonii.AAC.1